VWQGKADNAKPLEVVRLARRSLIETLLRAPAGYILI
jgi:hypothetical protein